MVEEQLNAWLNAATVLVFAGAAFYLTLIPYMTRDE